MTVRLRVIDGLESNVSLITNATDREITSADPHPTCVHLLFGNSRLSAHPVQLTHVLLTQSHDETHHWISLKNRSTSCIIIRSPSSSSSAAAASASLLDRSRQIDCGQSETELHWNYDSPQLTWFSQLSMTCNR